MSENKQPSVCDFSIGDFTFMTSRSLIIHEQREISITPKMLAVMLELAKHPGETLSKDQLLFAVWGSVSISEGVLSRAIADLRKVLGDSAKQQKYIATVSKQGYRLIGEVVWHQSLRNKPSDNHQFADGASQQAGHQAPHHLPLQAGQSTATSILNQPINSNSADRRGVFIAALVTLLASVMIWWFADRLSFDSESIPNYAAAPKLVKLTANNASERRARFSPDGEYIVYDKSSAKQRARKLFLHALSNNEIFPLTVDDQRKLESSPVFSPGGSKIAFRRITLSQCEIVILNLITRQEKILTQCPFSMTDALDWSPADDILVAPKFDSERRIESLILINTESGEVRPFATPDQPGSGYLFPRFSPDGQQVAVVYLRPETKLWAIGLINLSDGQFTQVLQTPKKINQVLWDQFGESLYYVIEGGGDEGIWEINLGNRQTKILLNAKILDLDYNNFTGQFIYVKDSVDFNVVQSSNPAGLDLNSSDLSSSDLNNSDVNSMDLNSLELETQQNRQPLLSPDGNQLLYISSGTGKDALWRYDLRDNTSQLLIQQQTATLSEPAWSPDSQSVAITLVDESASRILQIDISDATSQAWAIENNAAMPKWSADGRSTFWSEEIDGKWHLIKQDSSGQQQILLSEPIEKFEVTANNRLIYQKIGEPKLYQRAIFAQDSRAQANAQAQNQDQDQLEQSLAIDGNVLAWSLDFDRCHFVTYSRQQKKLILYRYDFKNNQAIAVMPVNLHLPALPQSLTVTQNSDHVFYTVNENRRFDLVLMSQQIIEK